MGDFATDLFTDFCKLIYEVISTVLGWLIEPLAEMDWIILSDDVYYTAIEFLQQFQVIVLASYALLIVVGGFLVMTHESLQTRYSVREIAPRLVVGALLSGLAITICFKAMILDWDLVGAFIGTPFGFFPEGQGETEDFESFFGRIGFVEDMEAAEYLLAAVYLLVASIAVIALIITAILRNIAWFFVVALAPVGLACHGLPVTERFAHFWWRMLAACMASSIGQAVLVWVFTEITAGGEYGAINGIVLMDSVYALIVVWMMWRLHIEVFKIARGRPISIPGSRLAQALVMSKLLDGASGRGSR